MKFSFTIILFFCSGILLSQNLVVNPDFENYSNCPNDSCEISNANGWDNASYYTSYFNTCGTNGYGIPNNKYGFQQASSGNGYASFSLFVGYFNEFDDLAGQLTSPLVVGQKYFVSFNISLAEKSTAATDRMGLAFSTKNYTHPCGQGYYFDPAQTKIFSDSIISDS